MALSKSEHGFPILAQVVTQIGLERPYDADGYEKGFVLVDRQQEHERYVTWAYSAVHDDATAYFWGHYYDDLSEAWVDFAQRVETDLARAGVSLRVSRLERVA